MNKQIMIIGIIVLLITVGISGCFGNNNDNGKNSNTNYIEEILDERFFGTWINITTNQSPEYPLAWYAFYPNGTCLTSYGELRWYNRVYHYANESNNDFSDLTQYEIKDHNQTFYDAYDFTFSNDNRTLNLTRHIFSPNPNSNYNITTKFYNKLNETLSVEEVIQNSELYLAPFTMYWYKWFDITVVGYCNSTGKKLVSSLIEPSYMLNIKADNRSLLRDGIRYYCKGILREYYETPLRDDFILDVKEITLV